MMPDWLYLIAAAVCGLSALTIVCCVLFVSGCERAPIRDQCRQFWKEQAQLTPHEQAEQFEREWLEGAA